MNELLNVICWIDINSAISWQQQVTSLLEIQQPNHIAAYAVVISMKINQQIKPLVVFMMPYLQPHLSNL